LITPAEETCDAFFFSNYSIFSELFFMTDQV
jgi:hypothetical protein